MKCRHIAPTLLLIAAPAMAQLPTTAPPVSPTDGSMTVVTGGTAQVLFAAGAAPHGCMIQNGQTAADQGIGAAENAEVRFDGSSAVTTSIIIYPGNVVSCPLGLNTSVSILAATTGHILRYSRW